jgi:predicted benzoate:H+ symporter BenE
VGFFKWFSGDNLSLKVALIGFVALAVLASACMAPTSQNNTTANQTANTTSGLSSILPGNFSSILPGNFSSILPENITNILPSDIKAKIKGELNESS